MKKGLFKTFYIGFLLVTFFHVSSCATLDSLFDIAEEEDPASFDRGYYGESEEETVADACEEEDCESSRTPASVASEDSYEDRENVRVRRAIEARDVVLGMTRQQVINSWGNPLQREVAGNGRGGHERWTYGSRLSLDGAKTVIFENGKVAGWHR